MKHTAASFVALFFSLALVLNASAHVTLLYPTGGESFEPDAVVQVAWRVDIPHNQENWDLYFSSDGGLTWEAIGLDLPVSQLTYAWVVPEMETETARIRIVQDNDDEDYEASSGNFSIGAVATAIEAPPQGPEVSALSALYPNPFTTATVLEVSIPRPDHVVLEVYDVQGVKVSTLVDGMLAAGDYPIRWTPEVRASGVYLCRLTVGGHTETKTVLLMK